MGFLGCVLGNVGARFVFHASLAGWGEEWRVESEFLDQLRRAVLIGIARRGVRWGLRVSNLSPLVPGEGGAGQKLILSHHSAPSFNRSVLVVFWVRGRLIPH